MGNIANCGLFGDDRSDHSKPEVCVIPYLSESENRLIKDIYLAMNISSNKMLTNSEYTIGKEVVIIEFKRTLDQTMRLMRKKKRLTT